MKTIKPYLLLSLALFLFLPSCKKYKRMRNLSFDRIEMIKNNVLLVRLKSSENKAKILREANRAGEIAELELKTKARNQETIRSFRDNFDFCEVYFFDPVHGENLRDKKFDEVVLIDKNNNEVEQPPFLDKGYLVATFGYVYADVITFTDDENVTHQTAGTQGVSALVVLDENYVQVARPFPYRVTVDYGVRNRNKAVAVTELNGLFKGFYNKMERKRLKQKQRG